MATLPPDWNEFIGLLIAKKVRYLIVGARALAASGRPRATQDLDIFVDRTNANITRLAAALRAFGFADLADERSRFEQPERMATLGKPPLRIDIMNHIDGVTFRDATRRGGRIVAGHVWTLYGWLQKKHPETPMRELCRQYGWRTPRGRMMRWRDGKPIP